MKLNFAAYTRIVLFGFLSAAILLLCTACQPQPAPTIPATATSPAEETAVPTHVAAEVPTATVSLPTPTLAPSPTPSPAPTRAPGEPLVSSGTPIPVSQIPISLDNLEQVDLLARWGTGIPERLAFSADGSLLGVETRSAHYLFETTSFTQVPFDQEIWEEMFSKTAPSYDISFDSCTTTPCDLADVLRDGVKVGQIRLTGSSAVSPDGSLAAGELFNGRTQDIVIYDLNTSQQLTAVDASAKGEDGQPIPCFHEVDYLEFSPNQELLVAICQGGAYLFRVSDGKILQTFSSPNGNLGLISFSPDSTLFTAEVSNGMLIWQVADGELLYDLTQTISIPGSDNYISDFSPDVKYLAVAQTNGILQIYDMTNGNLAYKLLEETPNEGTLDFSPDGSRVATIAGGSVQLRSVVDGSLLSSTPIEGYPFDVFAIRFSPGGRKLALSGGTGIDIWDLPEKPGAEMAYQGWIKIARYDPGIVPYPYKIAFHPEKNSLLVLSEEGLQTFSLASLASTGTIEIPAYPWDFDISPSGEWVAIGTTGGLEVLSYPAGKRIFNESFDGQVEGVLFSPDGSTLLVSVAPIDSSDADYYLYSSQDWSVLKRIPGTVELGLLQNYSPDGQLLATADGQTIILRRASDAVGLTELKGHSEIVTDLAFSPDGTLMASTGLDGTICIWGIP